MNIYTVNLFLELDIYEIISFHSYHEMICHLRFKESF